MKVYTCTLTHLDLPLLEASLKRFYETVILKHEHILLDHHWPIEYWKHRHAVLNLAERYGCKVMSNYVNLGGHGGANWVMQNLPMEEDDIFLGFDGDSFPETIGWDHVLIKGMEDPSYAALSLFINASLLTKTWIESKTSSGIRVVIPGDREVEMYNVTAWRYSFMKKVNYMQALYPFYGQVEMPMHKLIKEHGLKHAYTLDAKEVPRPFHPHPVYTRWKEDHVAGKFSGNFKEYWDKYSI